MKGLGQKRSLHEGKRNHKTVPLIEVRRFIFYLECFFLMKIYYTTPGRWGQWRGGVFPPTGIIRPDQGAMTAPLRTLLRDVLQGKKGEDDLSARANLPSFPSDQIHFFQLVDVPLHGFCRFPCIGLCKPGR